MTAKANVSKQRQEAVVAAAQEAGFLEGSRDQIGARVPSQLLAAAKERSGLSSTTEVIEYALAKVAIEDSFVELLLSRKGRISSDLDLEF